MKNAIRNHSHMTREARIVQGYDFICRYAEKHGYPPTVRELGKELGYTSTSSAFSLLKELEQRGFIRRNKMCPRAITILSLSPEDQERGAEDGDEKC